MAQKSAVPRPNLREYRHRGELQAADMRANGQAIRPEDLDHELTPLEAKVVELYGRGLGRHRTALILHKRLTKRRDLNVAKRILSKMEKEVWFGPKVWEATVKRLMLEAPLVANALAAKAKLGKVHEAKFFLELIGLYSPHGDQSPTQVNVVIQGVPRPAVPSGAGEVIEGEVVDGPRPELTEGED